MTIARHVRITGLVQGVFYRQWTVNQARALGVAGWVRNCADGSVEAQLEGESDKIERLIVLLREGPPHARVDKVETSESEIAGLKAFEVRH